MRWCQQIVLVGLGNPGRQYELTRHNVGFLLMDQVATCHGFSWKSESQFQAQVAKGTIQEQPVVLLKPQTYMNESGVSVGQLCRWLRVEAGWVLVVSDDVHLPLGIIRIREGGGTGGHNGLKSVQSHLGTTQFPRMRLGVGSPEHDLVDHVLGKFREEENQPLEQMLRVGTLLVDAFCAEGWQGISRRWAQWVESDAQRHSGTGAEGTSMPAKE